MLDTVPVAANVSETLHRSPVMFIENVGQFDEGARFQVHGGNGTLWLTDDALWITIVEQSAVSGQWSAGSELPSESPFNRDPESEIENRQGVNLRLSFPNANPHPHLEPFDLLETTVSYFLGNDPDGWRPAVPVWGGVRYVDLYPGIDLEVTSKDGQFVQRLHAQPGADLSQVKMRVEGAEAVEFTETGNLRLSTAVGDYTLPLLAVGDASTEAQATIRTAETGVFDIVAPFIIYHSSLIFQNPQSETQNQSDSPRLFYSTFLGGNGIEEGASIAVDNLGNVYIAGYTSSVNFTAVVGPDLTHNGSADVFVAKVNAAGTGLIYAGFLGGSDWDEGDGIAVDDAGNAYITGRTHSLDFPAIVGPDLTHNGDTNSFFALDAFVAKVNAAGTGLIYAGFLGGSGSDWGRSIAVDNAGSAYVTGYTTSINFPAVIGPDLTYNGDADAFVTKVNATGTGLVYAGFLGGSSGDSGIGIAVDGTGNAYVTGGTSSTNFPAVVGPDLTHNGSGDVFVAKVNATGAGLIYAGFLGGSARDVGEGIAVDSAGNAYITGWTGSTNFPVLGGPYLTHSGSADAFVSKVNAAGTGLVYAGFLGGSNDDWGYGIAVDDAGNAYVTGYTDSANFPVLNGPDLTHNGGGDTFIAKINTAGARLNYASFLGGSDDDWGCGIAVDDAGTTYVTGRTESINFPTTPGVFDTTHNDSLDAFVSKIELTYAISGYVAGAGGNAIADIIISDGVGHTVTTDNNGYYRFFGLTPDTYILTPTKPGWVFTPPRRIVTLPPNAAVQDFTMLHPPVSITLSLSGTVSLPSFLTYVDTQGLTTTITFPAGTVTTTTIIVLTPTLATASANLTFAGHAFDIEAYQDGTRQPSFTLEQPVIVTIQYSQQDRRLISDESQLTLYRWTGDAWIDAACGVYTRQLTEKWLSVPICGLSHFALLGPTNRIYLPMVLRQH